MGFCGAFFLLFLVFLFVLFLVLVLRFPLENPAEHLPKLARSAGAGRSQRQLGQLGAGASWARGQLAWAASQQTGLQTAVYLGLLHQAHKRKKLKEKTLQRVSGRSGQLRADCATSCLLWFSLSVRSRCQNLVLALATCIQLAATAEKW